MSGARWQPCCARPPKIITSCPEPIRNRQEALALLTAAGSPCLDAVVQAVQKHSPDDLAAAYLVRARRNDDPVDLLRATTTATGFNRALALEWLGLRDEAIQAWDGVVRTRSEWSAEARARRDAKRPDPMDQWSEQRFSKALERRDRATVTSMARAFPVDAALFFEKSLDDVAAARLVADVLAQGGDAYPKAIVAALDRPADREALARGLEAWRERKFGAAAALLEKAGNPLHLAARVRAAYSAPEAEQLRVSESLAGMTTPGYPTVSLRIRLLRAFALEPQDRYLEAQEAYRDALRFANGDPTMTAAVLNRRSANYATIGRPDRAFRDSLRAIRLRSRVANLNESHQAYASAAKAARALGYTDIAFLYQNAAVRLAMKAVQAEVPRAKSHLAIALRGRAEMHAARGDLVAAESDAKTAADLAAAVDDPTLRSLRMRLPEVRGDVQLANDPAAAGLSYSEAIRLAMEQESTYRAVLHFKRAEARRRAGDAGAEDDVTTAFTILREEARLLLDLRRRGEYEELWSGYFSRFEAMHHAAVERSIAAGRIAEAFVAAEQARAFEPMHVLLQSQAVPEGFRPIRTVADLDHNLRNLPAGTAILQYVVLPKTTYAWVLTRGRIRLVRSRAGKEEIGRWAGELQAAVRAGQRAPFTRVMRAVYAELFRTALAETAGAPNVVIVADGPMHGLPFAALQGTADEGYVIERRNVSTAGSTSLYLYSRARDAQLRRDDRPSVVLVGDPAFDERTGLRPLPYALQEVEELRRLHYPGAAVLTRGEATIARFLEQAREATIVHFAGHAVANPQQPWRSMLYLAPQKNDWGALTAETLMRELSALERTRLVVLGACSTAGGQPVGPEGLAPLVRPLIAANVPAVVGTLWDVNDATSKDLLVSLHCHYRHGDDVAVALRAAQLERLRNNDNPMTWAAFQVIGHAESPYPPRVAQEETHNDGVCAQNSLHRPDGLHSQ